MPFLFILHSYIIQAFSFPITLSILLAPPFVEHPFSVFGPRDDFFHNYFNNNDNMLAEIPNSTLGSSQLGELGLNDPIFTLGHHNMLKMNAADLTGFLFRLGLIWIFCQRYC